MQLSDVFLTSLADSKGAAAQSADKKRVPYALDFQSALSNQQNQLHSEKKAALRRQEKADVENARQSREPVRESDKPKVRESTNAQKHKQDGNVKSSIVDNESNGVNNAKNPQHASKENKVVDAKPNSPAEGHIDEAAGPVEGELEQGVEVSETILPASTVTQSLPMDTSIVLQPLSPSSVVAGKDAFLALQNGSFGQRNLVSSTLPSQESKIGLPFTSTSADLSLQPTNVVSSPNLVVSETVNTALIANPLDASFKLGVVDAQASTLLAGKASLLGGTPSESRGFSLSSASTAHPTMMATSMDPSVSAKTSAPAESQARFSLDVQFGRSQWNNQIANKVAEMAAKNLNFAEIQLDPPELGPLQVRVSVNQEQAAVTFTSAAAQVRDALENGHSRLRDMLEKEGLDLVDVDVRGESEQGQNSELESEQDGGELSDSAVVENSTEAVTSTIELGVDAFV